MTTDRDDDRSPGRAGSPECLTVLNTLARHEKTGLSITRLQALTRLSVENLRLALLGLKHRGRAKCKGRGRTATWHPVIRGVRRTFPNQLQEPTA